MYLGTDDVVENTDLNQRLHKFFRLLTFRILIYLTTFRPDTSLARPSCVKHVDAQMGARYRAPPWTAIEHTACPWQENHVISMPKFLSPVALMMRLFDGHELRPQLPYDPRLKA